MAKKYFIGTSGWQYPHWKGRFYPESTRKKDWFEYYSERFGTVEANYSFYNWPSEKTLEKWRKKAPKGFKYTMKAPRLITHFKKLKGTKSLVERFYRMTSILGQNKGVHLFQLPPSFKKGKKTDEKLEKFLNSLDARKSNAIEFRDKSWWNTETYSLLEKYKISFCTVIGLGMPADFINTRFFYARFHGKNYATNYSKKELRNYAEKIRGKAGSNSFIYFNNDYNGFAPKNALELKKILEGYNA